MTHSYDSSFLPLSSCSRISLSVICTWLHSGWTGSCVTKIKFLNCRFVEKKKIFRKKKDFSKIPFFRIFHFFFENWAYLYLDKDSFRHFFLLWLQHFFDLEVAILNLLIGNRFWSLGDLRRKLRRKLAK